jgi:hypothetical protein
MRRGDDEMPGDDRRDIGTPDRCIGLKLRRRLGACREKA